MFAEGSSDKEDFARFNVHNKDTVHEMVLMFKELSPSNPECGVSQVDVEEWIDADTGIEVSHTVTDDDLINAVMNPDPENKNLQSESSDEEIATDKILCAKAADAYSMLLKFTESQPCYLAHEVMQSHILHSNFLQK
jgi:hypothetical protein